jgi:tetratricopeptide (TPR) repeat protein
VAIDRDATLRKAEKLLRQGRLDQAIAEYLTVIHEQPRDWSTVNAVGDLLVRAGQLEGGVEHFTRIADHFFDEGFLPRAAAVYKKIVKLKPDAEHAALRTAEISERQGLLADAKVALLQVAERRIRKGDKRGAAEIHLKVGALDPSDLASGMAAARAAAELGDTAGAVQRLLQLSAECTRRKKLPDSLQALDEAIRIDPENHDVRAELVARFMESGDLERAAGYASSAPEFKAIATEYYSRGRGEDALQVLQWALEHDPDDFETRRQLVRSYIGRDDLERARALLSADVTDPDLLLSLAEIELRTGRLDEGRQLVCRVLEQEPGRRDDVALLGGRLGAADAGSAFQCVDAATDAAVAEHDWTFAANALHDFVAHVPGHTPALMKLVEVCVDGGLDATMYAAQAQLADAYLKDGRANEARVIAEDLVAREPWEPANVERLRSALTMLGEPDPDSVIADRLSGDSTFTSTDLSLDFSFRELAGPPDSGVAPAAMAGRSGDDPYHAGPASIDLGGILGAEEKATDEPAGDTFEIDLSSAFGAFGGADGGSSEPATAAQAVLSGLERVFDGFRDEAARYGVEGAAKQFRQAVSLREAGDTDGAVRTLEQVVRVPRYRFKAAAELARIHRELGRVHEAIEWLERAAEAAPAATDESRELLYDLGLMLSEAGENERALAVFLELQADDPDYRDVAIRVGRLSQKA